MAKSRILAANKKIEKTVVNSYQNIEQGVVDTFASIQNKFVDTYLTKDEASIEEAKLRLKQEQASRKNIHKQ